MELELTATTNLQRATIKDANGAEMHNKHDPEVKHKNVQIVKEDTELNSHVKLLDRNKLLEQQYGKMIDERNKKTRKRFLDGKIGQEEYQRRLTTVTKYLTSDGKKPKQALTTYVFTLGNITTEFQILDALGFKYERQKIKDSEGKVHDRPKLTDPNQRKKFADIMKDTYVDLAKRINSGDYGLKVVDVWVHMDEGGMPHAQGEMVNCGRTRSGKPSYNLNQALAQFNRKFGKDVYTSRSTDKQGKQVKSANGRVAFRAFRKVIDNNMLSAFDVSLKKHGFNNLKLHGIRLGRKGGLSMNEYQQRKQAKKDLTDAYEVVTGKKAVDEDNHPLAPLDTAKGLSRASKAIEEKKKQFDKKEAEQKKQIEQQKQQLDSYTQQIASAQQQVSVVKIEQEKEKRQLRKLKRLRQQREQQEADHQKELQQQAYKVSEYDKIKATFGNVPKGFSLSAWIKKQFKFVKSQADQQMQAITSADRLKKALVEVMVGVGFMKEKDKSRYVNESSEDWLCNTAHGFYMQQRQAQAKQRTKRKQNANVWGE